MLYLIKLDERLRRNMDTCFGIKEALKVNRICLLIHPVQKTLTHSHNDNQKIPGTFFDINKPGNTAYRP